MPFTHMYRHIYDLGKVFDFAIFQSNYGKFVNENSELGYCRPCDILETNSIFAEQDKKMSVLCIYL